MNILLREHVDKANEVNEALREDVSKLMADWTNARDELEHKESEWRKEREVGICQKLQNEAQNGNGVWGRVKAQ